mgnify:CR=1 FL=1
MTHQQTNRPATNPPSETPEATSAPRDLVRAWFPRLGERLDQPTPGEVFDRQIDHLARQAHDLAEQISASSTPKEHAPPRDTTGETT